MNRTETRAPRWTTTSTTALVIPLCVLSVGSTVGTADMTTIPDITITMGSASGGTTVFSAADFGSAWGNPNGTFGFDGASSSGQGGWGIGWSLLVNPDPYIIANWVVTNNALTTESFLIHVNMPFPFTGPAVTSVGGSIVGSVTDLNGDGATVGTVAGQPLYRALVNGDALVATLLDDPFEVTTDAFGSAVIGPAVFGDPIPDDPGPSFPQSMQIELNFTLTPGDSASFSSIFVIQFALPIPAPGAFVTMAMIGLTVGRRRRRSA